ncbi:MAG: hypothetical protein M1268_00125 [Patescibacteria group bacterium]|nr:hypothetical protein [Patescibacteria group bacterium]
MSQQQILIYRKLTKNNNQQFGVLLQKGKILNKKDIETEELKKLLKSQLVVLEELLRDFDEDQIKDNIESIISLLSHEHLHQGQLVVMLREAGIDLPERFKKSWNI